jgi:hypothetical protein
MGEAGESEAHHSCEAGESEAHNCCQDHRGSRLGVHGSCAGYMCCNTDARVGAEIILLFVASFAHVLVGSYSCSTNPNAAVPTDKLVRDICLKCHLVHVRSCIAFVGTRICHVDSNHTLALAAQVPDSRIVINVLFNITFLDLGSSLCR